MGSEPEQSQNANTELRFIHRAIMAPFNHAPSDSTRILSDLAPVIMTPRIMNSAATLSSKQRSAVGGSSSRSMVPVDFASIGRAPLRLALPSHKITSRDLQIVEATEELLQAEVPELEGIASNVSLLRGFNATIPSSEQNRARRRQMRNVDTPRLGLKRLGLSARGLMTDDDGQSVTSEEDIVFVSRSEARGRGKESLSNAKILGKEELNRQAEEIMRDKGNLHVRRSLVNNEIEEITHKIETLDGLRAKLERDLLRLQEDELELDAERTPVRLLSRMQTNECPTSGRRQGTTCVRTVLRKRPKGRCVAASDQLATEKRTGIFAVGTRRLASRGRIHDARKPHHTHHCS
jgi:division protein 1